MTEQIPLLHSLPDGFNRLGIGRSKGYELIAAGALKVVKIGSRTLITETELQRYVHQLSDVEDRFQSVSNSKAC